MAIKHVVSNSLKLACNHVHAASLSLSLSGSLYVWIKSNFIPLLILSSGGAFRVALRGLVLIANAWPGASIAALASDMCATSRLVIQ